MLKVRYSNQFKKDYKLAMRRGLNMELLDDVIRRLASGEELPKEYKEHQLSGKWRGFLECHIQPDWLMVWEQNDECLTLLFIQTGTHSDIFK